MVDKILYYITMRLEQIRIEIDRGNKGLEYPPYRWGLIEGEKEALRDIEGLIHEYKNAEMGEQESRD